MFSKLKSRKLWMTVASNAGVALMIGLGLDPALAAKIIAGITGSYLLSQGYADGQGK